MDGMSWLFGGELLAVGSEAPDFRLSDESGQTVQLSSFRGKQPVVLVFYPMDETPGCRGQLCELRDHWDTFAEHGAAVLGINPGGTASHRKFKQRHNFPFPLLVDEGKKVASQYGAGGLIVKRSVYAIGTDGRIVFAQRGKPPSEEILAALPR
jgi:thioredoxin-dependent peroxiredoxin